MKYNSNHEILKRIVNLRLQKRYSQEYMAHRLSISQNAYSKMERGLTNLNIERLVMIAQILGVSLRELMADLTDTSRTVKTKSAKRVKK